MISSCEGVNVNDITDFSKEINIEVNLGKTKVMEVRRNKHKSRVTDNNRNKKIWRLGDDEIGECDSYEYLRVTIKSNGSLSEHAEKIKEKAQKAYFPFYQRVGSGMAFSHVYSFIFLIIPSYKYLIMPLRFGVFKSGQA